MSQLSCLLVTSRANANCRERFQWASNATDYRHLFHRRVEIVLSLTCGSWRARGGRWANMRGHPAVARYAALAVRLMTQASRAFPQGEVMALQLVSNGNTGSELLAASLLNWVVLPLLGPGRSCMFIVECLCSIFFLREGAWICGLVCLFLSFRWNSFLQLPRFGFVRVRVFFFFLCRLKMNQSAEINKKKSSTSLFPRGSNREWRRFIATGNLSCVFPHFPEMWPARYLFWIST